MSAAETPAQELRTAATRLRCDHSHPVQPPHGSLARPGDCSKCDTPRDASKPVSDELRKPLAAWLDDVANRVADHVECRGGDCEGLTQISHALAVAREINREP